MILNARGLMGLLVIVIVGQGLPLLRTKSLAIPLQWKRRLVACRDRLMAGSARQVAVLGSVLALRVKGR